MRKLMTRGIIAGKNVMMELLKPIAVACNLDSTCSDMIAKLTLIPELASPIQKNNTPNSKTGVEGQ